MSDAYWQAKIWGLLHDPVLKQLHNNGERGGNSFWRKLRQLEVIQNWVDKKSNSEVSYRQILRHIRQADYISSASDRTAIASLIESINYCQDTGLEISHLMSGAKHNFKIKQPTDRKDLLQKIPEVAKKDIKQVFWWLWRCLPEVACREFQDDSLMLMPAETRLPDSSIWSHASTTAALAGALAGYDLTTALTQRWSSEKTLSHPYLASFTFTPVQELIKASRKMRDFWAGSWLLHYLSAKVCWQLALQYGPDSFIYPSLFQQPLIDHWLLRKFPEFKDWVNQPSDRSLLTAGFPNVLVLVLPKDKVQAAMQTAKQTLLQEWQEISSLVFNELHDNRHWMRDLQSNHKTWQGWLKSQWQFYWAAVPIGIEGEPLKNDDILEAQEDKFLLWRDAQNQIYNLTTDKTKLFQPNEINFLQEASKQRSRFSVNVGSWWAHIFDQTRYSVTAVKNARNWQIPTAFGPRSTISGIGPVVHPGDDWMNESETKKYWERQVGLFDGREQLNATETIKRGLEKVLPKLLQINDDQQKADAIAASYPDLTSGVAGYLKVNENDNDHQKQFKQACEAVITKFPWVQYVINDMRNKWGIPWIDDNTASTQYHPRLLNAGWLVEDIKTPDIDEEEHRLKKETDQDSKENIRRQISTIKTNYRAEIQKIIDRFYPNNNPTDWYVLAAGDGDGMSEWLQGKKLKNYGDYIPSGLSSASESFLKFLSEKKRMGPSTHNALSRALLDFSNQLVPYLTEQRYAGRLIYGGGDDVLAYTNLWEWDRWLWDIRQCFRGDKDPHDKFNNQGDYWQWKNEQPPLDARGKPLLSTRPLFTMGGEATISFGVTIAHHSVPLAIALDNMWKAEAEAKEHKYCGGCNKDTYIKKDAVQVRIMYSNGNILKATAKFDVFNLWQKLLNIHPQIDAAIFEQAASIWSQHPVPMREAILPWTKAFCDRREQFKGDETAKNEFQLQLAEFLKALWITTPDKDLTPAVQNWLKLAALTIRNRDIKLGGTV